MHHRIYTLIKFLNRIFFPATGAIYFGLSKIYSWKNESQVLGIIIVLAAISGIIIQFTAKKYEPTTLFQGELIITENPDGRRMFSLELSRNPDEIASMESITFKVVDSQDKQVL